MKKIMLYFIILTMLFTTACAEPQVNQAGKPVIKIGYLPITHAGPLFVASQLPDEASSDYTIELVKFGSWPDLMDALNTGRIDGASVLLEMAMKAKELGIDLKAVALGHESGNVLVSSHDIASTTDLKGETYAIPHKFSTHNLLLNEMLKKDGLSYEDVNVVEMAPAEMPAALAEDRIAGYVVAEPFGAMSIALNTGKVHYHSDEIWPDAYCCVLVLRKDFIDKFPNETQNFVTHYIKAGALANQKDDVVHDAFGAFMKVEKDVLDLSLQWISYHNLRIEKDEYDKLSDLMVEMGLTDNPPAYEDFVDNTFIDEAM